MNTHPSDDSVHITGEQRLHPALRTLGRACIALARWQREQQTAPTPPPSSPPPHDPPDTVREPHARTDDQEGRDA